MDDTNSCIEFIHMTLHPIDQWVVPEDTVKAARASFPKGNIYMKMYDELGSLYVDKDFEELFPVKCGQSAISRARERINNNNAIW